MLRIWPAPRSCIIHLYSQQGCSIQCIVTHTHICSVSTYMYNIYMQERDFLKMRSCVEAGEGGAGVLAAFGSYLGDLHEQSTLMRLEPFERLRLLGGSQICT